MLILTHSFLNINKQIYLQIIYSEDEEVACKDFTRDFYRLVNIKSESTRSLHSHEADMSDSSSECDDGNTERLCSPTPSEAGLAQVSSCSSSDDSGELGICDQNDSSSLLNEVLNVCHKNNTNIEELKKCGLISTPNVWRRSTGWRRVSSQSLVSSFFFSISIDFCSFFLFY